MKAKVNLNECKGIELQILEIVDSILKQHGIVYYISYGTCIGAIRHKGFIPWDDDIDISIPRDQYETARIILQEELPSGFLYVDNRVDSKYPYNFGKVKKRNTAFVHGSDAHLGIHHGIYIDIFPLDNCPNDLTEAKKFVNRVRKELYKVTLATLDYHKYGKLRPLWQLPLIFIGHLLFKQQKVQNRIDKLCMSYKGESDRYVNFLTPYGTKDIHEKRWFLSGQDVLFEGHKFLVPYDYDSYLRNLYGNYMQLPPEEKRVSHHDVVFYSPNTEYKQL